MKLRSLLKTGGAVGLGVLAVGAVQSSPLPLAMTPGPGTPRSAGGAPMPDPACGGVITPPLPANLTAGERAHLETFDALDFEVFTTHDWARLAESHAPNIRVHFPDGHYTDGIDKHIADMASWAEWAPDIAHPCPSSAAGQGQPHRRRRGAMQPHVQQADAGRQGRHHRAHRQGVRRRHLSRLGS